MNLFKSIKCIAKFFSHTIIFLNAIEEKMNGAFIDDTKQA